MMIVRFSRYKPNKPDLEINTPILRISKLGDIVEIEFDGTPSMQELEEIARRLGLPKIETIQESRLIRHHVKPKKIVFVPRKIEE